jgi:hypothetical protein
MSPLEWPVRHPAWFYALALTLSALFGVRGVAIQMHTVANENRDLKKDGRLEWKRWQRVLVHYFQDFIYNFVGSLAGWVALYLLSYRLLTYAGPNVPPPPPGFFLDHPNVQNLGWTDLGLAAFAILGITAKLPQTIEGFIRSIAKAVETVTGKIAG